MKHDETPALRSDARIAECAGSVTAIGSQRGAKGHGSAGIDIDQCSVDGRGQVCAGGAGCAGCAGCLHRLVLLLCNFQY